MAAWFEGNKGGRALCHFARLTQCLDFGMGAARFEVEALPDNLAAVCDNAADARIGRGGKTPQIGKAEGLVHHGIVCGGKVCVGEHGDTVSVWVMFGRGQALPPVLMACASHEAKCSVLSKSLCRAAKRTAASVLCSSSSFSTMSASSAEGMSRRPEV